MEHYVVEGIIEQRFKIALALLIQSYFLNRFLYFSIKIVVRIICEIRQYLIDTADLGEVSLAHLNVLIPYRSFFLLKTLGLCR